MQKGCLVWGLIHQQCKPRSDINFLSDFSKDSFHSAEFLVKFLYEAKPAHNKVSYKSIIEAEKYELLRSIDFPAPLAILPHEKDSDAVFTKLSMNSDNDQTEGPSSASGVLVTTFIFE